MLGFRRDAEGLGSELGPYVKQVCGVDLECGSLGPRREPKALDSSSEGELFHESWKRSRGSRSLGGERRGRGDHWVSSCSLGPPPPPSLPPLEALVSKASSSQVPGPPGANPDSTYFSFSEYLLSHFPWAKPNASLWEPTVVEESHFLQELLGNQRAGQRRSCGESAARYWPRSKRQRTAASHQRGECGWLAGSESTLLPPVGCQALNVTREALGGAEWGTWGSLSSCLWLAS